MDMQKRSGFRTILSVTFERTEVHEGTTPIAIHYNLHRLTAFGMLEASARVSFNEFVVSGPEVMDGSMLKALSARIHEEETAMLLETSANTDFGVIQFAPRFG
jgi:hypothetical protein